MAKRAALASLLGAALLLPGAAPAEVVQRGELRVGFDAELRPRELPRQGSAPVGVRLKGTIVPLDGALPPRLRSIEIAINRHGRIDPAALPTCAIGAIQPATTRDAMKACRRSFVGEGRFSAEILIPAQTPFPSRGRVVAFNGRFQGRPAILAHVYGTEPAPTSFTLPFRLGRSRGTFGTVLRASLPRVATNRAYVTGIEMTLGGSANRAGRPFVRAGCPAPSGFPSAVFPLARASFDFVGAPTVRSTLVRGCTVRD